jgi:rod shape determining protein RodA
MIVFVQKFYYQKFRLLNISNLKDINIFVLMSVICLSLVSCFMLYSTSGGSMYPWAIKQIIHFMISFLLMMIIISLQPKFIAKISYFIYIVAIILLIIVKFAGHSSMGAQRWIDLKIFSLQPSEVVKVAIILILAKYFDKVSTKFNGSAIGIIPPIMILFIPFVLVAIQPDLATSIIIICLTSMMIFASGGAIKNFIGGGIAILLSMPIIWSKMHAYQKKRILNFIDPDRDPFGSGYNIIQSKIAIGSGGISGKGFMSGWQSQLNFLPENHTDFIFAAIAEEFGLIGCLIILLLYSAIIGYGFFISINAKNIFLKMTSFGSSCFFFLHISINAGMVIGILPAAGVPMPMISYGGSNLMMSMFCIGLIFNAAVYSQYDK